MGGRAFERGQMGSESAAKRDEQVREGIRFEGVLDNFWDRAGEDAFVCVEVLHACTKCEFLVIRVKQIQ